MWYWIILCLIFWAARLPALDVLPLHNDEGLHLTRAVEVWNLHPFWQISDGKIINHWAIALFYPQHAPVFAGRIATLFVALLGLAAGWSVARQISGTRGALLALALWIASSYLFFYERLALSDAEAGALVLVTLWASLRLVRLRRWQDAALTGLALAAAALFKFTAVPFAIIPLLVVAGLSNESWQRRLGYLLIIGVVVAACFAVPLGYLFLRGRDFFTIALGWIGGGSGGENGAGANIARLWAVLTQFGTFAWALLMLAGLALLPAFKRRAGLVLLATLLIPTLTIILFGSEVLPRHYVVALPLAFTLAGAGLGLALKPFAPRIRQAAVALVVALLALGFVPFALQAYANPGELPLPQAVRTQYITDHSSGYGLREAVLDFPRTLSNPDLPVIASMFPDSCRRANFYVPDALTCTAVPGRAEIEAALAERGEVYVLADNAPSIGIDISTLDAQAQQIAAYARPGETTPSVVLWYLTHE